VTCVRSVVFSGFLHRDITEILLKVALNTKKIKNRTLSLIDRLVYITGSPNIHCHDMKDPTQLCSFNYFINTKKIIIYNNVEFTTVNELLFFLLKKIDEVYYIDINLTI
jgi:hypothetical protein